MLYFANMYACIYRCVIHVRYMINHVTAGHARCTVVTSRCLTNNMSLSNTVNYARPLTIALVLATMIIFVCVHDVSAWAINGRRHDGDASSVIEQIHHRIKRQGNTTWHSLFVGARKFIFLPYV